MTSNIIWFNPDISRYQAGKIDDFKKVKNLSSNAERFELIGSVPQEEARIANKVITSLNLIHETSFNYN